MQISSLVSVKSMSDINYDWQSTDKSKDEGDSGQSVNAGFTLELSSWQADYEASCIHQVVDFVTNMGLSE